MKEIIDLNRRLRSHLGRCFPNEVLVLERADKPQDLLRLPAAFREEVDLLRAQISHLVPDDFDYILGLGDGSPFLSLTYNDGAQTQASCPQDWNSDRSILEQLKELDWDSVRGEVIGRCQIFNKMLEVSKDAPVMLPSTKKLQKACRVELRPFLEESSKWPSEVRALLWHRGEGLSVGRFADLRMFASMLPDMMTLGRLVVVVCERGRALSVERIEQLKKQALKELEDMPISYAKALGKL